MVGSIWNRGCGKVEGDYYKCGSSIYKDFEMGVFVRIWG